MNSEFGIILQEMRKKHNLSQEELADKLGVSRQAVSKWERGEAFPDIEKLIILSRLFNVTLDDLIGTREDDKEMKHTERDKYHEPFEGEVIDRQIKIKSKSKRELFIEWFSGSFVFLFCTLIFFILGIGWNLWHPAWIVFLMVPVLPSVFSAVKHRSPKYFCYPVFVVGIYVLIGHFTGAWHPWWLLFLSIPLYYVLCEGIDILTGRKTR